MVSMQMEDNSPSPQLSQSPTPHCVGREFVRQYYTLLAEAPRYVHRFYSNESIFVHGTDTEEVVGQTAIQNKIRDLSFEECRTRIRALDAHETLGKGVVVQVVGEISVSGGPMRRFVQTFVLAPQSEKKYYVHNDIFRYEDELFAEKLPQENGAPADPDAVSAVIEHSRVRGPANDQAVMNNGNTHHPEEIQNVRYTLQQGSAQPQPIPAPALSQPQTGPNQVAGSGYAAVATSGSIGVPSSGQPQGPPTSTPFVLENEVNFGSVPSIGATTMAPPIAQQPAAPSAGPYGQQPLPQRSQPQQHPAAPPAAPMPSTQPLQSEPISAVASTIEQPQRPSSVDKTSPAPSDDREEPVEAGSANQTWAARVTAQKNPNRSPHQIPAPQQAQHVAPIPGTSAPAMSPTGTMAHGNHGQAELVSKTAIQQQQHQPGRHGYQHRQPRQSSAFPGAPGQDTRSSPAPSGHQYSAGGGNRTSSTSSGPVDTAPLDHQAYLKNLPMTTNETELKEYLESQGFNGILEVRVRRKNANNSQQTCFAFVAFDSMETAQKLLQKKTFCFNGNDIFIDAKRNNVNERNTGGGGGGNHQFNGRQFPPGGGAPMGGPMGGGGMARGGMNPRNMGPRGGGAPNRSTVAGVAYGGQGGGRPQGRIYSNTGRSGGNVHHPQ